MNNEMVARHTRPVCCTGIISQIRYGKEAGVEMARKRRVSRQRRKSGVDLFEGLLVFTPNNTHETKLYTGLYQSARHYMQVSSVS